MNLTIVDPHISRIILYLSSADSLISFSIMSSKFIHVVHVSKYLSFLKLISHWTYRPHFAYLLIHRWTLELLLLLTNNKKCCCQHCVQICVWVPAFKSFGYIPKVEVEMLDHMVILCLIFWGITILFSIVAVSFYIPTNSPQRFQFLYILANTYFLCVLITIILISVKSHEHI